MTGENLSKFLVLSCLHNQTEGFAEMFHCFHKREEKRKLKSTLIQLDPYLDVCLDETKFSDQKAK